MYIFSINITIDIEIKHLKGQWRSDRKPPSDWPMRGDVTFEGYKMRYRSDGELVLRGIDLKIYHNEKVCEYILVMCEVVLCISAIKQRFSA